MNNVHFSSNTNCWATPQDLFDRLNAEFHFTLDVCALPENAKCEQYFTPEQDGLKQIWTGVCFMNPPYGRGIAEWVRKARESALEGATVVCLLPARTDTRWWWDNVVYGEIRFLKGRLKFGGSKDSAPFPSAIVVFRPGEKREGVRCLFWEPNPGQFDHPYPGQSDHPTPVNLTTHPGQSDHPGLSYKRSY